MRQERENAMRGDENIMQAASRKIENEGRLGGRQMKTVAQEVWSQRRSDNFE